MIELISEKIGGDGSADCQTITAPLKGRKHAVDVAMYRCAKRTVRAAQKSQQGQKTIPEYEKWQENGAKKTQRMLLDDCLCNEFLIDSARERHDACVAAINKIMGILSYTANPDISTNDLPPWRTPKTGKELYRLANQLYVFCRNLHPPGKRFEIGAETSGAEKNAETVTWPKSGADLETWILLDIQLSRLVAEKERLVAEMLTFCEKKTSAVIEYCDNAKKKGAI